MAVTKSVTEFLKIPMYEMTSEEFYSLYMDVDSKGLGIYKPLKSHQPAAIEKDANQSKVASKRGGSIAASSASGDSNRASPIPTIKSPPMVKNFS